MAIQILPARLANQIAAGEVVERPASVVKELIENSLDAGASRIEIDIEKGGAKLIRIRDNGQGIAKDELALALSRHATSKVSTLEDLESIMSLGFRGEALASISSVARLTLTSKPAAQSEAWQAMAQGRDMDVKLVPASHPTGTTLEVQDLFFNTPARRKFMRTDKTEFGHIDEVVRRIALSRFDVDWVLRHNGKQVRQYRAARLPSQQDKRLSAICGSAFMQAALKVECEHNGLRLWGWWVLPSGARAQPDVQYTYVNGRMMRDKLLNHAIRQAYGERLAPDTHGAFVLYLELDPAEVDVNVHPAKHEVRFQQARLVHDFIYQVLAQALEQAISASSSGQTLDEPSPVDDVSESAAEPVTPVTSKEEAETPLEYQAPRHGYGGAARSHFAREQSPSNISEQTWQGINGLLTTLAPAVDAQPQSSELRVLDNEHGGVLQLVKERALVVWHQQQLWLCELNQARAYLDGCALFAMWEQGLTSQPLLLPIRLALSASQLESVETHQAQLLKLGLELKKGHGDTIILTRVPQPLRHADLARLFGQLLAQLEQQVSGQELCLWLCRQGMQRRVWSLVQAHALWLELQACLAKGAPETMAHFLQPLALEQQLDRWDHER
ncbi:DNA mismatch repair endonuclease MutL [Oceanisphaera avium]|uniref:DNA mismatch repair protein MutL n=1 Tax=Oceanisphaera avium TaxID=1903694 RepID=A0A1Y0CX95_9GAMM|nr:DNA mismatch repair endonuclease MutL [Oceanisphaera avium]ART79950.1 DNA mismatch repair protein MutL [Oceanisphaera avium]